MTKFSRTIAAGAAAAAAILTVAPAFATSASWQKVRTVAVDTSGLNLSTEAGQRQLQTKVEQAARSVCGPVEDVRDLEAIQDQRDCRRNALALADPQVAAAIRRAGLQDTRFATSVRNGPHVAAR